MTTPWSVFTETLKKKLEEKGWHENFIDDVLNSFDVVPQREVAVNPKDLVSQETKLPLEIIPWQGLFEVVPALMEGARKYGPLNWRDYPVQGATYLAAGLSHYAKCLDGSDFDECGAHEVAMAVACGLIYLDALKTGVLVDNRPSKGKKGSGNLSRNLADVLKPECK